jgi:hypothetical protein
MTTTTNATLRKRGRQPDHERRAAFRLMVLTGRHLKPNGSLRSNADLCKDLGISVRALRIWTNQYFPELRSIRGEGKAPTVISPAERQARRKALCVYVRSGRDRKPDGSFKSYETVAADLAISPPTLRTMMLDLFPFLYRARMKEPHSPTRAAA